ncbi:MAG: TRAP transporter large permease [Synergistaceae bacterium]|jgi:tripartite ATP-independent transporter DctM subunit|nr:TRAP transporter large permease [Synergistaceae bacterium]
MEFGIFLTVLLFFGGLICGIPIGWVFLGSTFAGLWVLGDSIGFTATSFFQTFNSEILSAIGFFILAGNLLSVSGLASRIVIFTYALVGQFKGGLVSVAIVGSTFMGALTGSSLPCIAALAPIMVPELEKFGYKRTYTTAVLCASSFLGYLIPPSVPALIYCLVAQQSVAALFLSTVIPGLILTGGYILLNSFIVKRYMENEKPPSATNDVENPGLIQHGIWISLKNALPALGCPLIILVGIYGGLFTPSEAGAVAVFYTVLIGWAIYRELSSASFLKSVTDTVRVLGMSVILLGGGTVLTRFFLRYGVAQSFAHFVITLFNSKTLILLSINIFLLILGMFIDGIPILVLAVPLILPIAKELGINLVHLGAFVIVNVGIGVITPPFAISIFFSTRLCNVKAAEIIPPILLYLFCVAIPVLLLTTYVPAISCWLPTLLLGKSVVGPW